MESIFKNDVLNKCFLNDGFIVLYNFFNEIEISNLTEIYLNNLPNCNKTFYTTQWITDREYKKGIYSLINSVINEKMLQLFKNYRSVYSYFMVKHPNDKTFSHIHQDWSIIDESQYIGINSWIPLIDVNSNNGAISVFPKSHKKYIKPRGSNIELDYYSNYQALEKEKNITLSLKKGDLLLFDNRLLHATCNNKSDKTRVAVGNIIIPNNASITHYYTKDKQIYKASLKDNFLMDFCFGDDILNHIKNNHETIV